MTKLQPPKIVQIVTSSDGRVIALGEDGRAYWWCSIQSATSGDIIQRWETYPELPIIIKKPICKKKPSTRKQI